MKFAPVSPDRLLTVNEAAAVLGISPGTLRHWVSDRRIEFVRVGRKLTRFRRAALDAFIERQTERAVER